MKRFLSFSLIAVFALITLTASAQGKKQMSDSERQKWFAEVRQLKHDYLVKELSLSCEQQNKFFPLYDEMEYEVYRISSETKDLESKILNDTDATDTEVEAAAQALYQQKKREGEVEIQYYEKFREILSPRQLIRLKNAERKFTQKLVRRHGRPSTEGQRRNQ